jgi:metallo-beta-lactamase family protein
VPFARADVVVMESTYGDRNHRSLVETAIEAREIIRKAIEARAKILVPVFAIGRTQLLLYLLAGAFRRKTLPRFPIYVDSPMAVEATRIYGRNTAGGVAEQAARARVHGAVRRRQHPADRVGARHCGDDAMIVSRIRHERLADGSRRA